MAIIEGMDMEAFGAWMATCPSIIQDMIRRCPPNRLYQIDSWHRVTIRSYLEDGTVTVNITGQYNRVIFGRYVFDIKIEELVECDLPDPNQKLGDLSAELGYTEEDIKNILIPNIKKHMNNDN